VRKKALETRAFYAIITRYNDAATERCNCISCTLCAGVSSRAAQLLTLLVATGQLIVFCVGVADTYEVSRRPRNSVDHGHVIGNV